MSVEDLSRREFLRATSAGVATAGVALSGCSLTSSSDKGGKSGDRSATVRFAMSGSATSADIADPAFSNTQHDGRLMTAVYEQLARYDDALSAKPWLAESWQPNEKGDVWQFRLRRGVTFHNGDRLTARDVQYTYRRLLDPKIGSPVTAELANLDPDGVTAVDDSTVRFRLRRPDADLPLSLITKQTYIVPDGASSADLRKHAVGTGPFELKEFAPGSDTTVFVRNTKYWEPSLPRVGTLQLVSIGEPGSRVAALTRGQVDIIEDPPETDLARLKSGSGTAVVSQPKGNMELIAVQIDKPPFDDNRVRLALKYALDRDAMRKLVAQQQGVITNDIPIASMLQFALQDPARQANIAKAKSLLAEAGHANGLNLKLAVSNVQARFVEFATTYKELAAQAGIHLDLDVSPADSYWDDVWLKVPMFVSAWIARPTPAMLRLLFLSKSSSNETHWNEPEWDRSFQQAQATLDPRARGQLYSDLQSQIVDQGGYLVPYMHATIGATRKEIAGWRPSGTFFERFDTIQKR